MTKRCPSRIMPRAARHTSGLRWSAARLPRRGWGPAVSADTSWLPAGYAACCAHRSRPTADYKTVCTGRTDHAEVVEVVYDAGLDIGLGEILKVFFAIAHDPTQVDRQGNDVRPAIPLGDLLCRRYAARGGRTLHGTRSSARVPCPIAPLATELVPLEAGGKNPEPDLLPRGRPGRPLRNVGAPGAVRGGAARGVQTASLSRDFPPVRYSGISASDWIGLSNGPLEGRLP